MSEDEPFVQPPTSPTLDTNDGIITSAAGFSGALTLDLTDDEIKTGFRTIAEVRQKHMMKFRRKFNDPSTFDLDDALKALEEFEDEIKTRMMEAIEVLVTVDTVPLLEGQPPVIEWIGKIPGTSLDRYGMDHEKKQWEVRKAKEREENFLGEKDNY